MVDVLDFSGRAMENYGLITYREVELLHPKSRTCLYSAKWPSLRNYVEVWDMSFQVVAAMFDNLAEAQAALDGAESKLMLVDDESVVGENPASLRRLKLDATETKDKDFSNVLIERLHDTFGENSLEPIGDLEAMAIDGDNTHAMETDKENEEMLVQDISSGRKNNGVCQLWAISKLFRGNMLTRLINYLNFFFGLLIHKLTVENFCSQELLMSLKAGGIGLNLTATSNVFLMWNPEVEEQAIMRIHRIGQKRTVLLENSLSRKQRMIAGALTDEEVRSARLEELKMLFR
nr:putative SWI/SNF-related matrix-associated actin-dependent regulator of chromatin subfamily A member 3-like 3 [Tanacetum cinerariifolium]